MTATITVTNESPELQAISNWLEVAANEGVQAALDYSAGVWSIINPVTAVVVEATEIGELLLSEDFRELADLCQRDLSA